MTRTLAVGVAFAALLAASVLVPDAARAADGDPPVATIVVNGAQREVEVIPLDGDGASPRADDVLDLGGFRGGRWMRGERSTLRFRSDQGRLFEIGEDGAETLVAVSISDGRTISAGLLPPDDALALAPVAIAGLRGITFEGWDGRFAPILARIDPSKCCVEMSLDSDDRIPALPPGMRALSLEGDATDLRPLATQTALRWLRLGDGDVGDWSPLAGMRELRRLEAAVHADAAATVPALPALTHYSAGYDRETTDVQFLARLPALRELNLYGTRVTDLTPIAGLADLQTVSAPMTGVAKLPAGKLPSLRRLNILGHRVPEQELRAFLDANPKCATAHSWRAQLDLAIAGVDGLRVRTEGQCHRSPAKEKVLLETSDAEAVRTVLAMVQIDDPGSSGQCMCCGGPTIELLRKGQIAASLTVHHGTALRWYGWPGDGRLVPAAGAALCDWLAKLGAPGPRDEVLATERRAAAAKARDAEQDRLLGAERIDALAKAEDAAAASALFRAWFTDTPKRLDALLRLAAPVETSGGGERRVSVVRWAGAALLGHEDKAAVVALLVRTAEAGGPAAEGAADFIDDIRDRDFGDDALLAELRLNAGRSLVASKDERLRGSGISILCDAGTPAAAEVLVGLLPSAGPDGRPATVPTKEQLLIARRLVRGCDLALVPRLRAVVAATPDEDDRAEALEDFDRTVARRRKKEPGSKDAPAPPK